MLYIILADGIMAEYKEGAKNLQQKIKIRKNLNAEYKWTEYMGEIKRIYDDDILRKWNTPGGVCGYIYIKIGR